MRRLLVIALVLGGLLCSSALAGSDGTLPDPALTPGSVRTLDRDEICNTRTRDVRNVPDSLKEKVRRAYGMASKRDLWCNSLEGCEIDHLVPLAIGGSNEPGDTRNLWPQPYEGTWNAHHKDQLEVRLRKLVCRGGLPVEEAQKAISTNWIEAYKKYVAPEPKDTSRDRDTVD